eukprot:CAMPEP_0115172704 /NCGR_PEP_ID=MMETSP0270-20121206/2952_1 /TAXON_ID=71861 /ORGANISM="Scrippsiella trochoidea, Strain CCMP3099" /LENGTH=284 /DNA_ID=CAMNT_0002585503 /DNA_START=35 /DNA_END=885 /DNA_ORIENTATION=-
MATLLGAIGGVVGGVAGAAGGVVGGVASIAGGVVGGVAGGVVSVARYALSAEEQDSSHNEDGPNIYEQKARVDQILHFFEAEEERYSAYFEDVDRLESLRVEYYNCVNAIEFQNELIAHLVDEVLELRRQLRGEVFEVKSIGFGSAALKAADAARKESMVRLAHAKLDIGERRSKRRAKEKERLVLHGVLSPLISQAKLQRFLDEQVAEQRIAEDVSSSWQGQSARLSTSSEVANSAARRRGTGQLAREEAHVRSSHIEAHESHATIARRRYKHYSDDELSALL